MVIGMARQLSFSNFQSGTSMLEVLITIVIMAVGLLGLAALQSQMQKSEVESYQRAQALILLNDMATRIASNRYAVADYVTGSGSPLGTGITCPSTTATQQQRDTSEWCNALQGAAEMKGTALVGAMSGARGCIEDIGSNSYMVTVAWEGLSAISAPPNSVACGLNLYNGTGCTNDKCRRAITTIVRLPTL